MYAEIVSFVITNHPMAETNIVVVSIIKLVLTLFLTYVVMKKSESAAIEITARGGIFAMLSSPKLYLFSIKNTKINIMERRQ